MDFVGMELADSPAATLLINLIQEFKSKPILWNRNHPNFHNTQTKDNEFARIAVKYNITVTDVKKKLKYLKENYSREKRLVTYQQNLFGDNAPAKRSWRYYDLLTFLDENTPPTTRKRKPEKQPPVRSEETSSDFSGLPIKREKLSPTDIPAPPQNFEDSSSDSEVLRLSPLSCPSPSLLKRATEHPESTAILEFIKTATDVLSKKNSSVAAYLDYLRIKFEEKDISDEKFQQFVDWTTDFVKTL